MTFDEALEQVRELLQSKGRIAYRALKRRFDEKQGRASTVQTLDPTKEDFERLHRQADTVASLISGLILYLRKRFGL
jgi:hypothetical protein